MPEISHSTEITMAVTGAEISALGEVTLQEVAMTASAFGGKKCAAYQLARHRIQLPKKKPKGIQCEMGTDVDEAAQSMTFQCEAHDCPILDNQNFPL